MDNIGLALLISIALVILFGMVRYLYIFIKLWFAESAVDEAVANNNLEYIKAETQYVVIPVYVLGTMPPLTITAVFDAYRKTKKTLPEKAFYSVRYHSGIRFSKDPLSNEIKEKQANVETEK